MSNISRRHAVFGVLAFGGAGLVAIPATYSATRMGTALGTIVSLSAHGSSKAKVEAALTAGFEQIRAVEKSMSLFDDESEISRLNKMGFLENPSPLFFNILRQSQSIWKLTRGAFDPTVQPLWNAWIKEDGAPSSNQISDILKSVGFDNLAVTPQGIFFKGAKGQLTLNGIAQGYATDLVAAAMRKQGVVRAYMDTGEIGVLGSDTPTIAIRNPRGAANIGSLHLESGFVATSGDYATSFTADFAHNHIFDPATGISPPELASVTVVAPTGAMADALATGFMVLGHDESLKIAQEITGVDLLMITKSGVISMSGGMKRLFQPA
jgi:FAD:protein FMN transferase